MRGIIQTGDSSYHIVDILSRNKKKMNKNLAEEDRVSLMARKLDQFVKKMKCSGATGVGLESFKDIKGRKYNRKGSTIDIIL